MKKKFAFILPILIFVPFVALAQYTNYDHIVGCGINTIPKFIKYVIALAVKVGIPAASVFFVWGGFLFFTAQGNESKLESAKKTFKYALIGVGVILASWLFAIGAEAITVTFQGGVAENTAIDPCTINNMVLGVTQNPAPSAPIIIAPKSTTVAPAVGTAPSAPSQLLAQAVPGVQNQVLLSWNPSTSPNITGYNVYQNGVLVGTTAGTSLQVSVVNPNLGYAYTVTAVNSAGEVSVPSASLSTSLSSLPGAPANTPVNNPAIPKLTATVNGTQVDLLWTPATGATSYTIKRDGKTIATVSGTSYSDMDLTPGAYLYTVTAVGGETSSLAYAFVKGDVMTSATGDTVPPTTPQNLTVTVVSSTQIDLNWDASTDDVELVGYKIYRDGVQIGYSTTNSYSDKSNSFDSTHVYKYTVTAFDFSNNESTESNAVTATPPPPPPVYVGGGNTPVPTSGPHAPPPTSDLVVPVQCTGSGDETAKVQAAVDQVGGTGGTVLVSGMCWINAIGNTGALGKSRYGVLLKSNMTFKMDSGAVLKALPNDSWSYNVLLAANVSNVNIVGGTLEGDRHEHLTPGDNARTTPKSGTACTGPAYCYGQWGYGMSIFGGSNIFVDSVVSREMWGDGFTIWGSYGGPTSVTLSNVVADDNRRQGLSITAGSGILVQNSIFQNTDGHFPMAGIDVEPDAPQSANNILIRDSQFINNYTGVVIANSTGSTNNVTVTGNTMIDNKYAGIRVCDKEGSGFVVTNNTITGSAGLPAAQLGPNEVDYKCIYVP